MGLSNAPRIGFIVELSCALPMISRNCRSKGLTRVIQSRRTREDAMRGRKGSCSAPSPAWRSEAWMMSKTNSASKTASSQGGAPHDIASNADALSLTGDAEILAQHPDLSCSIIDLEGALSHK